MMYSVVRLPSGEVLKEFKTLQEAKRYQEILTTLFKSKYPRRDIMIIVR